MYSWLKFGIEAAWQKHVIMMWHRLLYTLPDLKITG